MTASDTITDWVAAVQRVMQPHLHQVPYGNLRTESSRWQEADGPVVNLAIVYELPGGSTNQVNITYSESARLFTFLALDTHEERQTALESDVLDMVREAVERIPAARRQRLVEDIDRWAVQGLPTKDLFQKINKLLQIEDLRGGTITPQEMKEGIAHILAHHQPTSS